MLGESLSVLGACLGLSAGLLYAVAAWRGSVVPNRVTWSLWTVIPLIIFAASVSKGAGLQSLFSLAAGLGPGVVVLVILSRHNVSHWKVSRLDLCCCILSLLAIGLWIITRDGDYAIGLSLVADASAAFPTVVKAYKEPSSESAIAYVLFMVGAVAVLLATKHWTWANVAFPLYAAIMYFVLSVLTATYRASHERITDSERS
jgi:hypothetical protein